MEHLDCDEEEEDGEASANARNKAITSLLKGSKPSNHNHSVHTAPVETDEEESEDEDLTAVRIFFLLPINYFSIDIVSVGHRLSQGVHTRNHILFL